MKYPLSLLILLCLGCETIIEVDPPEYDSEPVVTSFFSPDSAWSLTMHRSLGATVKRDATREYIPDASVMIMDGSNTVDILNYHGNGRYVSSTGELPTDGIMYTLHVDFPSYTSMQAVSVAPPPAVISDYSIEALPSSEADPSSRSRYQLRIAFSDTPGTNFYRIGVYRRVRNYSFDATDTDSVYAPIFFDGLTPGWSCGYSSDEEVVDPIDGIVSNILCEEFVVIDRRFDGKDYSWHGTTPKLSDENGRKELRLILSSLSEDYYRYRHSLERNVSYDPLIEEPFPMYSNVSGGLGVFAGYTNTTLILPFPSRN
ncbi:MAG: DUF4249 domain-containing protein [Rhodothermaceae bacterium]|nr:DUF4249 domain-containing protein [Rhodothermaceae bacterium]MXW33780.1 DUF4249 domain-containing protein [Rhodothermaceae bacterium]MYC03882.1 DUF4249 domain-containing protein [Rhodothermaceae bacterium]MYE63840.1 DUF4249 domain-containing protein [Rhodothermaceae bacterium]MYI16634.1 DUF4249 domain-containing protein [Rhodothermaceae bacterium]